MSSKRIKTKCQMINICLLQNSIFENVENTHSLSWNSWFNLYFYFFIKGQWKHDVNYPSHMLTATENVKREKVFLRLQSYFSNYLPKAVEEKHVGFKHHKHLKYCLYGQHKYLNMYTLCGEDWSSKFLSVIWLLISSEWSSPSHRTAEEGAAAHFKMIPSGHAPFEKLRAGK